ncbi:MULTISPECIES: IS1182 family transposase [Deinococcus]|uniref:IS5/IS1182 family transposase n=1 Tax=Deinococcus arcticus TaxID=2136176 RepID=A0A2T3W4C8_9DEIO|nr:MULTISPECIES: IS1182 family transposase [Deinococcus]PTA66737.1 IS5/IS1182 family transposase [Deinococcus arcticus]
MMLRPTNSLSLPEDTARIAHMAFPQGNLYLSLRDEFGELFDDGAFQDLFSRRGRPALPPWRLALITVVQFLEGVTDRQAADQVRARIDLKYLLGLPLDDPGFHFSVLSEFRSRLIAGSAEGQLLDGLLSKFRDRGLIKRRGRQRTDSTHVLARVRSLTRLESVGETLRAALNAIATIQPTWLAWCPPEWFSRYGERLESARLPKGQEEGHAYACQIGQDGFALLTQIDGTAHVQLGDLPAVQTLRRMWALQFTQVDGDVRWQDGMVTNARERFNSPYDPEAGYGARGGLKWSGYKVHFTESCEEDTPHVMTAVRTTEAALTDYQVIDDIHQSLAERQLLPEEHLLDGGYISGDLVVRAKEHHGVRVIGPARQNASWQARSGGYDVTAFQIDWAKERTVCPQGHTSYYWKNLREKRGYDLIEVRFRERDCQKCPVKARCTRVKSAGRKLSLRGQAQHEAIQEGRALETSVQWGKVYTRRAGIEGTHSLGVRTMGLRRSRYRGQAKTHVQHVATAAAINLMRVAAWLEHVPRRGTRISRFAALKPQ